MAKDNRTLGRFILDGIPPAPRGVPQIEVTFDIDANGILHVTAKDKGTGKTQNIRIEAGSGLTKEEIEKMKNEAKMNEESDKQQREQIEKLNQADGLIFTTEKQLKDYGEKLPAEKKQAIESALAKLKEAHKNQNLEALEPAMTELNQAWTAASEELYKASQGQPEPQADAAGAQAGAEASGDTVTDVPYEEVK